jgi:hypothetical protein
MVRNREVSIMEIILLERSSTAIMLLDTTARENGPRRRRINTTTNLVNRLLKVANMFKNVKENISTVIAADKLRLLIIRALNGNQTSSGRELTTLSRVCRRRESRVPLKWCLIEKSRSSAESNSSTS